MEVLDCKDQIGSIKMLGFVYKLRSCGSLELSLQENGCDVLLATGY